MWRRWQCWRRREEINAERGSGNAEHTGTLRSARNRKSTRLNSSHLVISYAVFCLKKKKMHEKGFIQYACQGRCRRSNKLGIDNGATAAASQPLGRGQIKVRAMLSTEPWTLCSRF